MEGHLSHYACDECKSRKIRCSREHSSCSQCLQNARHCEYSRSGIIRRKRKRKPTDLDQSIELQLSSDDNSDVEGRLSANTNARNRRSSLKISRPREAQRTRDIVPPAREIENSFIHANPLLPCNVAQFWQDDAFIEMAERMRGHRNPLFTFEDEASSWTEIFSTVLKTGQPYFSPMPPEVLVNLATQPEMIDQKAYLVIFYGTMLTEISSEPSYDDYVKTKLRWNLWICLNDARLLLEPSDINIEALMLLAFHVQEFHTPALCWMITSTACRMLQALGINTRSLDEKTQKRRMLLFWFLNCIDKSLALIFGRAPSFSETICRSVPMPSFQQLVEFHPHTSSSNSLFGAHLQHSIMQASRIMDRIWSCLFSDGGSTISSSQVRKDLDDWHATTRKNLEASFLAEKPLLDAAGERSLELGIRNFEFHYLYLTVLLTRPRYQDRATSQNHNLTDQDDDCAQVSQLLLYSLDSIVSDSRDVYNGIVWQLLFEPFTAFFALLDHIRMLSRARGHIRARGEANDGGKKEKHKNMIRKMKQSADAMECLLQFLEKMDARHPLAKKLYSVASEHLNIAHRLVEGNVEQSFEGGARAAVLDSPPFAESSTTTSSVGQTSFSVFPPQTPAENTPPTQIYSPQRPQPYEDIGKDKDPFQPSDTFGLFNPDLSFGEIDWFEWSNSLNLGIGMQ